MKSQQLRKLEKEVVLKSINIQKSSLFVVPDSSFVQDNSSDED